MTLPTLQPAVIEALRSAGATEEMIAAAVKAGGESRTPHPGGRPRKHADTAARDRAYRERKKRDETSFDVGGTAGRDETSFDARDETSFVTRDETPVARVVEGDELRDEVRILNAAHWNVDRDADIAPIRALIDQGCDLEADILPIIAREVPVRRPKAVPDRIESVRFPKG
jgi:hypothetical protein